MVASHGDSSSQRIRRRKVAIIGSGLAGLTAAHLLSEEPFDVHIFEKSTRIGLDAASIDVRGQDGKIYTVDSPMRAVQSGKLTSLRPEKRKTRHSSDFIGYQS
jgi:predicted NAD/FAD-binding protein